MLLLLVIERLNCIEESEPRNGRKVFVDADTEERDEESCLILYTFGGKCDPSGDIHSTIEKSLRVFRRVAIDSFATPYQELGPSDYEADFCRTM